MAADDVWSKDQIKTLIDCIKKEELLWNPRKGGYMKRAQRDRAMKAVSAKLDGKGMYEV
jgi:hypothetical protein